MTSTSNNTRVVIVIPAYEPNDALIVLIRGLRDAADRNKLDLPIIVVNDGSSSAKAGIFDTAAETAGVISIRHAVNLGKGAALKTGFNHALVTFGGNLRAVVTADADGQHAVQDILKVVNAVADNGQTIILGARIFDATVPFRSRIGNETTKAIFKLFTGRSIRDTQTGLRGLPRGVVERAMRIQTQGYDFEFEVLLTEVHRRTLIIEVPIETIYEPGNPSSHFNPLIDSLKIYYVFVRFSVLGIICAALDYSLFLMLWILTRNIFAGFVFGRVMTSVFYFYGAKRHVFHSDGAIAPEAIKFAILVVASMCASYGLLTVQVLLLGSPIPIAKLLAETVLFLASFAAQRVLVFRYSSAERP